MLSAKSKWPSGHGSSHINLTVFTANKKPDEEETRGTSGVHIFTILNVKRNMCLAGSTNWICSAEGSWHVSALKKYKLSVSSQSINMLWFFPFVPLHCCHSDTFLLPTKCTCGQTIVFSLIPFPNYRKQGSVNTRHLWNLQTVCKCTHWLWSRRSRKFNLWANQNEVHTGCRSLLFHPFHCHIFILPTSR